VSFEFNEDLVKEVRDHPEIMFDGRYVHMRGKRAWEMKFTDIDVAHKVFQNIDECIATGAEWIEGIYTEVEGVV